MLNSDFQFIKVSNIAGSTGKYKGLINGVKFEDSFDPEIIDSDLSNRFGKIAQAIEKKARKIPIFASAADDLTLDSIEANTIGKGENKKAVYILQMLNLKGPNKNKIISGELTEEGLPKGLLKDLDEMSNVLGDILQRDRSQEEEEVSQQRLGGDEGEDYDEEFQDGDA